MIKCSVYFPDENEYFGEKFLPVDLGSTISRSYNETLDSADIAISNVKAVDRLTRVHPYSWAYLLLEEGSTKKDYLFLVDTFVESSDGVAYGEAQYYSYSFKLMSPTKLLEKVQLPNRTVTHSLVSGQKTVAQVIQELCDLYMPKIKVYDRQLGTWHYEPIIEVDTSVTAFEKLRKPCADISMSNPTLRQAITSLMVQCHCLPVVENMSLSFIDLDTEPTEINSEGANQWTESNASDSYVTTLFASPTQLIDDGNEVVNETLGFRDRGKVFLKSTENLKLETRFPIYDIRDAKLRFYRPMNAKMTVGPLQHTGNGITVQPDFGFGENGKFTLSINWKDTTAWGEHKAKGVVYQIDASEGRWKVIEQVTIVQTSFSIEYESGSATIVDDVSKLFTYPKSNEPKFGFVFTVARITVDDSPEMVASDTFSSPAPDWSPRQYLLQADRNANKAVSNLTLTTLYQKTITPLFVESAKRSLLDTDYLKMGSATTIDELSNYIYGTVSYSIGSKEITGFSQTYNVSSGWFDSTYTYMENILNVVWNSDKMGEKPLQPSDLTNPSNPYYSHAFDGLGLTVETSLTYNDVPYILNPWGTSNVGSGYPFIFFDLSYIPIADARMAFPKKSDHPYEIGQYDGSENGLVASRSYGLSENEKIARLGNNVLSIHRRVETLGAYLAIGDGLNRLVKGATRLYTTFEEKITLNGNAIDVTYTASADYVLKNYFTSVITKYRAYENVDYSKATTRKEHFLVYADIETYYYDGDDHLWFGSLYGPGDWEEQMRFVDAPFYLSNVGGRYVSSFSNNGNDTYMSELSIVSGETRAIFTSRDFDNASMGIYMTERATKTDGDYADFEAGQPQSWYPNDRFTESLYLGFTRPIGYYEGSEFFDVTSPTTSSELQLKSPIEYPKVDSALFDPEKSLDGFWWLKDKEYQEPLTINKDNAEVMQYSIQFEYVSRNGRVKLYEGFPRLCSAIDRPIADGTLGIAIHGAKPKGDFAQEDQSYLAEIFKSVIADTNAITKGSGESRHASFIIDWDIVRKAGQSRITLTMVDTRDGTRRWTDIISIEMSGKAGKEEWFLSFNDTNSLDVYDSEDSRLNIWSVRRRVKTNTNERETEVV